ncbi:MAG: hypothetical protein EOM28_09405 [Clostridia bacterium]|nr:hypothetical protein [Clostridia bacterium]
MTPIFLQRSLVEELKALFADFCSTDDVSGKRPKFNVYSQDLPITLGGDDEERVPYVIVRIDNGNIQELNEQERVEIILVFCVKATNENRQGYLDVMNMIQRVKERFFKNFRVGEYFFFEPPFEWAVQEEDTFPYFYGAVKMNFYCPAIILEDGLI